MKFCHEILDSTLLYGEYLKFLSHLVLEWYRDVTDTKRELEIWGKAQRKSARRPKSDWGGIQGGGKIFPKSRGPNSNALAYTERALST